MTPSTDNPPPTIYPPQKARHEQDAIANTAKTTQSIETTSSSNQHKQSIIISAIEEKSERKRETEYEKNAINARSTIHKRG